MKIKILLALSLAAVMCFAGCKSETNTNTNTTNVNTANTNMAKTPESAKTDTVLQKSIEDALKAKGYNKVTVDTSTTPATLRGTYPKDKLADVMQTAQTANGGKPVQNQATGE